MFARFHFPPTSTWLGFGIGTMLVRKPWKQKRLTFCLLGVATPFELIQDPRHTPFNIGHRVELKDFTSAEAITSLLPGFTASGRNPVVATQLLNRVMYWTGGQPYLTQRLCGKLAEDSQVHAPSDVDRWCETLFLNTTDREADDHLLFVRERLLRGNIDKAARVTCLSEDIKAKFVSQFLNASEAEPSTDEEDPVLATLRLSGIAFRNSSGTLSVRNRIYHRVFNSAWASAQMPDAERLRLERAYRLGILRTLLASSIVTGAVGALAIAALLANNRARRAESEARQAETTARRQLFVADMNLAQRAFEESNIPRTLKLLKAHRARAEESTRFEWRYLWKQCHREAASFRDKDSKVGGISTIQFLKDSRHIRMVGTGNVAVQDWDIVRNRVKTYLPGLQSDPSGLNKATISPRGDRLARCLDDHCVITQTATKKTVFSLKTASEKVWVDSLAFSEDSHLLAVGDTSNSLCIWDIRKKTPVCHIATFILSARFSPDNRLLATSEMNGCVHLWDVASGKEQLRLSGHWGIVHAFAFSPDSKFLAVGARDGIIRLFNTTSGQINHLWKGHTAAVTGIEFATKGEFLVTSSADQTVRIWNPKRSVATQVLKGSTSAVETLAISPDKQWLATGNRGGEVAVWKINNNEETPLPASLLRPLHAIRLLLPEGRYCTALDKKNYLAIWDTLSRKMSLYCPIAPPEEAICVTAFSQDGTRVVTTQQNGRVTIRDTVTGRIQTTFISSITTIAIATFSPKGDYIAIAGNTGQIEIWQTQTGKQINQWVVPDKKGITALLFFPTRPTLIAGNTDGSRIYVLTMNTGGLQQIPAGHTDVISDMTFNPDGTILATVSFDATIKLWRIAGDSPVQPRTLDGHIGQIYTVSFSPDGKTLATSGYDGIIRLWDVTSAQEMLTLSQPGVRDPVVSLQFTPENQTLLSVTTKGNVYRWGDSP